MHQRRRSGQNACILGHLRQMTRSAGAVALRPHRITEMFPIDKMPSPLHSAGGYVMKNPYTEA